MPDGNSIADDLIIGIGNVTRELYGIDTEQNRRRVYRQRSEVKREQRLRGLITYGGQVALIRSIARADLQRRAEAAVEPLSAT